MSKDHLSIYSRSDLDTFFTRRPGETRLGETVHTIEGEDWEAMLNSDLFDFVLLGIPEDIGIRANHGIGNAQPLWPAALTAILNVQDTEMLQGHRLLVLGAFNFDSLMNASQEKDPTGLRELVGKIDEIVTPVIAAIRRANKIPIVIGGGHNNAYPLIKGASSAAGRRVNCINLDAHADFRALEGRHSGNGFRYAKAEGYLEKYTVVGLHQNYNSQAMLNEMDADPDISYSFYEDIFLHQVLSFQDAIENATRFTAGSPTGIEIDLDCIERVLSSAMTPAGITTLQARQFLNQCLRFTATAWLHITEGALRLTDERSDVLTAKLVAYLVTDFLRGSMNKSPEFIRDTGL